MSRLEITTTAKLELAPKVKTQLLTKLREFEANQIAIKAMEADNAALKAEIEGIFSDNGASEALDSGSEIEGFKTKMIYPSGREVLDKMKLVAYGVPITTIEKATVKADPGRPYLKISIPGAKEYVPKTSK